MRANNAHKALEHQHNTQRTKFYFNLFAIYELCSQPVQIFFMVMSKFIVYYTIFTTYTQRARNFNSFCFSLLIPLVSMEVITVIIPKIISRNTFESSGTTQNFS